MSIPSKDELFERIPGPAWGGPHPDEIRHPMCGTTFMQAGALREVAA